jgi:menaquinol-cytochrome c reductase iron-sulfur subunit
MSEPEHEPRSADPKAEPLGEHPGGDETARAKRCQEDVSRRRFLTVMSFAAGGLATAVIGVPVAGFVIGPLFERNPEEWRAVGAVDKFEIGKIVEVSFKDAASLPWSGVTAGTAAWLHRENADQFKAYSVNCTHLGCPVRWLPDANLFMCPCHGGVYYKNGEVAAGPPPRPLQQYRVRVTDGQVEVQTGPIPITTA